MIRLVQMGSRWYGLKVDRIDDQEAENIETFVNEGSLVVFCYGLEDVEYLGINVSDVEMVD